MMLQKAWEAVKRHRWRLLLAAGGTAASAAYVGHRVYVQYKQLEEELLRQMEDFDRELAREVGLRGLRATEEADDESTSGFTPTAVAAPAAAAIFPPDESRTPACPSLHVLLPSAARCSGAGVAGASASSAGQSLSADVVLAEAEPQHPLQQQQQGHHQQLCPQQQQKCLQQGTAQQEATPVGNVAEKAGKFIADWEVALYFLRQQELIDTTVWQQVKDNGLREKLNRFFSVKRYIELLQDPMAARLLSPTEKRSCFFLLEIETFAETLTTLYVVVLLHLLHLVHLNILARQLIEPPRSFSCRPSLPASAAAAAPAPASFAAAPDVAADSSGRRRTHGDRLTKTRRCISDVQQGVHTAERSYGRLASYQLGDYQIKFAFLTSVRFFVNSTQILSRIASHFRNAAAQVLQPVSPEHVVSSQQLLVLLLQTVFNAHFAIIAEAAAGGATAAGTRASPHPLRSVASICRSRTRNSCTSGSRPLSRSSTCRTGCPAHFRYRSTCEGQHASSCSSNTGRQKNIKRSWSQTSPSPSSRCPRSRSCDHGRRSSCDSPSGPDKCRTPAAALGLAALLLPRGNDAALLRISASADDSQKSRRGQPRRRGGKVGAREAASPDVVPTSMRDSSGQVQGRISAVRQGSRKYKEKPTSTAQRSCTTAAGEAAAGSEGVELPEAALLRVGCLLDEARDYLESPAAAAAVVESLASAVWLLTRLLQQALLHAGHATALSSTTSTTTTSSGRGTVPRTPAALSKKAATVSHLCRRPAAVTPSQSPAVAGEADVAPLHAARHSIPAAVAAGCNPPASRCSTRAAAGESSTDAAAECTGGAAAGCSPFAAAIKLQQRKTLLAAGPSAQQGHGESRAADGADSLPGTPRRRRRGSQDSLSLAQQQKLRATTTEATGQSAEVDLEQQQRHSQTETLPLQQQQQEQHEQLQQQGERRGHTQQPEQQTEPATPRQQQQKLLQHGQEQKDQQPGKREQRKEQQKENWPNVPDQETATYEKGCVFLFAHCVSCVCLSNEWLLGMHRKTTRFSVTVPAASRGTAFSAEGRTAATAATTGGRAFVDLSASSDLFDLLGALPSMENLACAAFFPCCNTTASLQQVQLQLAVIKQRRRRGAGRQQGMQQLVAAAARDLAPFLPRLLWQDILDRESDPPFRTKQKPQSVLPEQQQREKDRLLLQSPRLAERQKRPQELIQKGTSDAGKQQQAVLRQQHVLGSHKLQSKLKAQEQSDRHHVQQQSVSSETWQPERQQQQNAVLGKQQQQKRTAKQQHRHGFEKVKTQLTEQQQHYHQQFLCLPDNDVLQQSSAPALSEVVSAEKRSCVLPQQQQQLLPQTGPAFFEQKEEHRQTQEGKEPHVPSPQQQQQYHHHHHVGQRQEPSPLQQQQRQERCEQGLLEQQIYQLQQQRRQPRNMLLRQRHNADERGLQKYPCLPQQLCHVAVQSGSGKRALAEAPRGSVNEIDDYDGHTAESKLRQAGTDTSYVRSPAQEPHAIAVAYQQDVDLAGGDLNEEQALREDESEETATLERPPAVATSKGEPEAAVLDAQEAAAAREAGVATAAEAAGETAAATAEGVSAGEAAEVTQKTAAANTATTVLTEGEATKFPPDTTTTDVRDVLTPGECASATGGFSASKVEAAEARAQLKVQQWHRWCKASSSTVEKPAAFVQCVIENARGREEKYREM